MKRRFHATLALLGDVRGKTILDAGCGTGVYTIYLTRLGAKVSAIDLSGKMLERTRENARAAGLEPTGIIQGDFMEHDFGQEFDHVLAIGAAASQALVLRQEGTALLLYRASSASPRGAGGHGL
jgi:cyclopropane fatty-acyl-phospholipid synthase-like methyltransferase